MAIVQHFITLRNILFERESKKGVQPIMGGATQEHIKLGSRTHKSAYIHICKCKCI